MQDVTYDKGMKIKEGYKLWDDRFTSKLCTICGKSILKTYAKVDEQAIGEKAKNPVCESCATEEEYCKVCGFTLYPDEFPCHGRGYCMEHDPVCMGRDCTVRKPCAKCAASSYSHSSFPGYVDFSSEEDARKAMELIKSPGSIVTWSTKPKRDNFFYKEYKKGGGIMSVVNKIKNLAKSKETKLLEKYYVTDDCGNLTEEGKATVLQKAFEAHKAEIVKDLEAVQAEEDKKKS